MTRCNKSDVNFKSTVYNQTGQTYFQRLSAYNSMSSHLRRVLLARSVVDSRNDRSLRHKERRCRSASCGRLQSNDSSKEVIDRLTLNSGKHPQDVLRMTLNRKFTRQQEYCDRCGDRCEYYSLSQSRTRGDFVNFDQKKLFSKSKNFSTSPNSVRELCFSRPPTCSKAECVRQGHLQLGERRYRCGERGVCCATVFECMSNGSNGSLNSLYNAHHSENYEYSTKLRDFTIEKEEEAKYAKFVYDITQDIVQNGFYLDKQLLEVFKKHIQMNKDTLNMNKMLQEIYQLKVSLEISEESEMDEEIEALAYARKFSSAYELKPPTPPKVLDENKVIEKLLSYQTSIESKNRSSSPGNKSVLLVDANPELYVTERDVLLTLLEVDINPDQAQYICKSLFHKSRETIPNELDFQDSLSSSSENQQVTPDETEIVQTQIIKNVKKISQEKNKQFEDVASTTEDLVSQTDQDVQVQELKNLLQDNYTICEPCHSTKDEKNQADLSLCSVQVKQIKPSPAKGRLSGPGKAPSLTKPSVGKNGKRVSTYGKVEKSSSSSRDSRSQISTEKLSHKPQGEENKKEEFSKEPRPAPRKFKGSKTKTLAQPTNLTRLDSTTHHLSRVAILSVSEQQQIGVIKEQPSEDSQSSFKKFGNESDRYSSDYEEVEEDIKVAEQSERTEDSSKKKESWIEAGDVDTDVSEINGYEYSDPEDTVLTENDMLIADQNK